MIRPALPPPASCSAAARHRRSCCCPTMKVIGVRLPCSRPTGSRPRPSSPKETAGPSWVKQRPRPTPRRRTASRSRRRPCSSGLPPPPRSFLLYFEPGTTTLTPQSGAVLPALRGEIAGRSGPAIEVTGHTDTVGSEEDNDRLSMKRAEEVLGWLASQGFDRSMMSAVGRGERELMQPTMDNVDNSGQPPRRGHRPLARRPGSAPP